MAEFDIIACENCKALMRSDAKYCNNCGAKVGSGEFSPERMEIEIQELYGPPSVFGDPEQKKNKPAEPDIITCENCKALMRSDAKYCPTCGMAVGKGEYSVGGAEKHTVLLYGPPEVFDVD